MGFFEKMFSGLSKSRKNLVELEELFQDYAPDSEDFYDDLEELLVLSDVGVTTAESVVKGMRKLTWERRFRKGHEAREGLIELLSKQLSVGGTELKLQTRPSVILMVGVNGVGKTTTIGKLAHQLRQQGKKVLLCAGDTFRAAAAEQLGIWAERAGAELIRHEEGSDPAAVVYDAICAAKARAVDVILVDTAGRLHNKQNLIKTSPIHPAVITATRTVTARLSASCSCLGRSSCARSSSSRILASSKRHCPVCARSSCLARSSSCARRAASSSAARAASSSILSASAYGTMCSVRSAPVSAPTVERKSPKCAQLYLSPRRTVGSSVTKRSV